MDHQESTGGPRDGGALGTSAPEALAGGPYAQTLSRGIRVLEFLAAGHGARSLAQISHGTGVGRSVTYRLLRTLAAHGLAESLPDNTYVLGSGLVTLAREVGSDLRVRAYPVLLETAERLGGTCFLGVADGEEFVCLVSAEPRSARIRVSYREGLRHPLTIGAGGAAILSARPPRDDERDNVRVARVRGYSQSAGEVETDDDLVGYAVPVVRPGSECWSSVVVLFPASRAPHGHQVLPLLRAASEAIAPATSRRPVEPFTEPMESQS